jgi:hypothetical protein
MANNNATNRADITGLNGKAPSGGKTTNASKGRVFTISGPGANVAKGKLSAGTHASIIDPGTGDET